MAGGSGDGFWTVKSENADPILSRFEESGFSIEFMHITSGKACVFPAWLTSFSDSFQSTWNTENVFGRPDPIGAWQSTARRISVALSIPCFTPEEGYANMHQLEHLIGFLYPSYQLRGATQNKNMTAYPLIKMKFANFVKNATVYENSVSVLKGGLSGWLDGLEYVPNLEAGFHHMSPKMGPNQHKTYNSHRDDGTRRTTNKSHTFIPKVFDLSFTFNVVHEHSLGWAGTTWLSEVDAKSGKGFPYGYEAQGGKTHDVDRGSTAINNSPMNRVGGASQNTSQPASRARDKSKSTRKRADVKGKTGKLLGSK